MCDVCGNDQDYLTEAGTPERVAEVQERQRAMVLQHGHQVMGIFGDGPGERFYYTVGRALFEKADLLLTGPLPDRVAMNVLNSAARMIDEGELLLPTDGYATIPPDTLLANHECRIQACDPQDAEMFQAINMGGGRIEAYQIIWPDTDGHFPDDPEYDARFVQPIHPVRT